MEAVFQTHTLQQLLWPENHHSQRIFLVMELLRRRKLLNGSYLQSLALLKMLMLLLEQLSAQTSTLKATLKRAI